MKHDRKTRRETSRDRRAAAFIDGNRIDTCTKVRFTSSEKAYIALAQAQEWGRTEKGAYYCLLCRGYHLTSRTSRFASRKTSLV